MKKYFFYIILGIVLVACKKSDDVPPDEPEVPGSNQTGTFPGFITETNNYYEFSIAGTPEIDESSYRLKISGLVINERDFTLDELRGFDQYERTQTTECIGNIPNGVQLATALWKGFKVMDLLDSVGLKEGAKTVNFICADGYVSSNSLEELSQMEAIGALYANQFPLLPKMGFPLRILNPGYFGVKNPGWVTKIEVTGEEKRDYWLGSGWNVENPMEVDTKIFFPGGVTQWKMGDTIRVGGAAFGNKEIGKVEYSTDDGKSWLPAEIVRTGENAQTWVFWEAYFIPEQKGEYQFRSRATDIDGASQPLVDKNGWDGTNSSPAIRLIIQ